MSTTLNLIYYAALFFFVIYFGKQMLHLFMGQSKDREDSHSDPKDFERLVEQKAQHLRLSLELEKRPRSEQAELAGNQLSTSVKSLGPRLLTHDSKYLKTILEDLNWGEGQELKNLKIQIEKKFAASITMIEVTSYLKEFLQNTKTIDFLNAHPALYPQLPDFFLSYFYLKLGAEKKVSFQKFSPWGERSFALMMLLQVKSLMEIIVDLERLNLTDQLQKISSKDIISIVLRILFKSELPFYLNCNDIDKKIKMLKDQSLYLDVLPTIKNNDKDTALRLFGLKDIPSKEELKSLYKEIALTCHPDRLPPGSPELLKKLASQNFVNLSLAYELLQKG
jgi:hypothetical protein